MHFQINHPEKQFSTISLCSAGLLYSCFYLCRGTHWHWLYRDTCRLRWQSLLKITIVTICLSPTVLLHCRASSSNWTWSGIRLGACSMCSEEWEEHVQGVCVGFVQIERMRTCAKGVAEGFIIRLHNMLAYMPTGQGRVGLFLLFGIYLEVFERILVLRSLWPAGHQPGWPY